MAGKENLHAEARRSAGGAEGAVAHRGTKAQRGVCTQRRGGAQGVQREQLLTEAQRRREGFARRDAEERKGCRGRICSQRYKGAERGLHAETQRCVKVQREQLLTEAQRRRRGLHAEGRKGRREGFVHGGSKKQVLYLLMLLYLRDIIIWAKHSSK
jgi:hypothetical protein